MAGPMQLRSWWEVAFVLAFVLIAGMSQVSPSWKHWGGPAIVVMCVIVVVALVAGDQQR